MDHRVVRFMEQILYILAAVEVWAPEEDSLYGEVQVVEDTTNPAAPVHLAVTEALVPRLPQVTEQQEQHLVAAADTPEHLVVTVVPAVLAELKCMYSKGNNYERSYYR
jgi:hypothetical protein